MKSIYIVSKQEAEEILNALLNMNGLLCNMQSESISSEMQHVINDVLSRNDKVFKLFPGELF